MTPKKKRRPRTAMVGDVRDWQRMAGNTPLEQMINSYLTSHFIWLRDVPADECLSAARKVIDIVREYGESADSGAAWDALGRLEFGPHRRKPIRQRARKPGGGK